MKKIKIYIPILAGALILGGCSKEFLEADPSEFVSKEQIDEAAEDRPVVAAGTLAGLYSLMYTAFSGGTTGHDDFGHKGNDIYSDMLTGDMVLGAYIYGWYRDIVEYQSTTDFTYQDNYQIWRFYYQIIYGANNVIDGLGGNDAIPDDAESKYVLGQAKAMRGFAYFYLANFFGEGYKPSEEILPIYTGLEDAQPLSTTEEVYEVIISDLTHAVELLGGFQRAAKTEINQDVAKGLLAYAYAAQGEYEEVKQLTQDFIGGNYPLTSREEVVYTPVYDEEGNLVSDNLTEAGFNDASAASWMWGVDITLDYGLDLVSWWGQVDITTYSYTSVGDMKTIGSELYEAIPENDVRKNQFVDFMDNGTLYPVNKFYHEDRVAGGQRLVTTDYLYMRAAEMYLLHAEASYHTGDEAAARADLRALLEERLIDEDESGDLIEELAYIDMLSGEDLLDEIYLQTRIELWGEGKSYLAMKRLEKTVTMPSNHLSLPGQSYSFDSDELTFEIPQNERQNNPNINL